MCKNLKLKMSITFGSKVAYKSCITRLACTNFKIYLIYLLFLFRPIALNVPVNRRMV